MSSTILLIVYCLVCMLASLAGGWIPHLVQLTHRRMQVAISFVSGVVLGIGLLHMVPHSFVLLGSIDRTVNWVLIGFLFMFFLERFFHFHHHEAPDELLEPGAASECGHLPHHGDQHHDHDHDHGNHMATPLPWATAAVGLALHGLIDGVALAAAVNAESEFVAWAGIGALLAIALHKPFDSLTIGTLMAAAGRSSTTRHVTNLLYALVTPVGVLMFTLLAKGGGEAPAALGPTLAFAGGAFICIAASDLLPELQFHRHDLAALSIALLAGIGLAWGTVWLEASGHDHLHGHEGPAHVGHDHEHHDHGPDHP